MALKEAAVTSEIRSENGGAGKELIWGIPVVGAAGDIYEYARTNVVDEVLLYTDSEALNKIADTFISMGIMVHICMESLIPMTKAAMNEVNGIPVVTTYTNTVSSRQMLIKRLMDICFGLVGSVATIILTIFVAPMIWLADPGPVFFKQERVGRNGRTFKIWKFRTMCVNADAMKADLMKHSKSPSRAGETSRCKWR